MVVLSIYTIFSMPVNNDIVDMTHDFGYHFGRKLFVTIVTNILYYKMGCRY